MRFRSTLTELSPLPCFPPEIVRAEPGQCRVPCHRAVRAGPVHAAFVAALPEEWRRDPHVEVFSRTLWMRVGWQPLSLGFHLDWGATEDSPGRVETLMANFGGCSFTEFVDDSFDLPDHAEPRSHGRFVTARVEAGELRTTTMREGVLCHFDNRAWHRARPAVATGWRVLVRAIRGLDARRRHDGRPFTTMRNSYVPRTPEQQERHAPYTA